MNSNPFDLDQLLDNLPSNFNHINGGDPYDSTSDLYSSTKESKPDVEQVEKKRKKNKSGTYAKLEPYEYSSIIIGDFIKYIDKNDNVKSGIVKQIEIKSDGQFTIALARGPYKWTINNAGVKEILTKLTKVSNRNKPEASNGIRGREGPGDIGTDDGS
jgi:hypothetical protein